MRGSTRSNGKAPFHRIPDLQVPTVRSHRVYVPTAADTKSSGPLVGRAADRPQRVAGHCLAEARSHGYDMKGFARVVYMTAADESDLRHQVVLCVADNPLDAISSWAHQR